MKKRNLLVILIMAVVLFITGCAKEEKVEPNLNRLLGKWSGTLDYTDAFTAMLVEENPDMEQFLDFRPLTFSFEFTFSEEEMTLHVDKESASSFITSVEVGIADMIDAMAAEEAAKHGITAEAVFEGMGVTRDTYVADTIKNMSLDAMVNAMVDALELQGEYETDEKQIVVVYDDKTYETLDYVLEGDVLTVCTSDGRNELVIECTKTE